MTQTTLSVDDAAAIVAALQRRFPQIVGPKKDDICYATQNRQDAVKFMAPTVDVVIVVGSPNSSNSNRLREVAAHRGVLVALWWTARATTTPRGSSASGRIGVTAGASAPELLVDRGDRRAARKRTEAGEVHELIGAQETVVFPCLALSPSRAAPGTR